MLNKSARKILKTFFGWKDDVEGESENHSVFSKARFFQVKVEDVNGISCFLTEPQPFSLEQIVFSQKDEKTQKNRIYQLKTEVSDNERQETIEKYFQVRVFSREYREKPAIAVYFYDLT